MTVLVPRRRILKPCLPSLAAIRRLGDPSFNRLGIRGQPWGLGRAGASFLPTDIPSLVMWCEGDLGLSLSDGDPLTTWPDQSRSDNDLTQSDGARKPTFKINIVNEKPVIRLDNVNDRLVNATLGATQPWMDWAVAKTTGGANEYLFDGDAGNKGVLLATDLVWRATAGVFRDVTVDPAAEFRIVMAIFNGADSRLIVGGTVDSGDIGATNRTVGLLIGDHIGGGVAFGGDIAAIGHCNDEPSDADINSLGDYLATKYAATWVNI